MTGNTWGINLAESHTPPAPSVPHSLHGSARHKEMTLPEEAAVKGGPLLQAPTWVTRITVSMEPCHLVADPNSTSYIHHPANLHFLSVTILRSL